jgi:hypothetical protein
MRTMFLAVAFIAVLGCVDCGPARAQQAATKEQFAGTWKLLSFTRTNLNSGKTDNELGERPRGYLILTADGRIAIAFVDSSRNAGVSQPPTDADAARLWRTMRAYIGRYQVDPTATEAGLKMTIRSEVADRPALEGVDRTFFIKLEGGKLNLTSASRD